MTEKNQKELVEKIRSNYIQETKQKSKLDELKDLDKKVRRPATIVSYVYGILGSLVLGIGLCLAMRVIGNLMALGIVIGLAGIGFVSTTHLVYEGILNKKRSLYADKIIEKSNELLNETESED